MPVKKLAQIAVSAMALLSLAVPAISEVPAADKSEEHKLMQRGYGQICIGLYNPAIETLTKAVHMSKGDVAARRYLIYAMLQVNKTQDALAQMKLLLQGKKPSAMDHYLLGEAHLQIGWIDSAEADFNAALKLHPEMRVASVGLIKVRVCNSEYDDALKLCNECIHNLKDDKSPQAIRVSDYFKRLMSAVKTAQVSAQSGDMVPGHLPGIGTPTPGEMNTPVVDFGA